MTLRSALNTKRTVTSMLVAAVLALLAPAGAHAAATIGSSLPAADDSILCLDAGGCTFVPTNLSGAAVAVPFDAVIVGWAARVPSGGSALPLRLRVLRPAGSDSLTGAGTGSSLTSAADVSVVDWPARLPVRAGDRIGIDVPDGGQIGIADHAAFDSASSDFVPRLGDGETRAPTSSGTDDFELLFNARIEPDADGDGFGDETQDRCPQLARSQQPCRPQPQARAPRLPRLQARFRAAPPPAIAGGEIHLGVVVQNRSLLPAPGVALKLRLPPETAPLGATGPAPCAIAPGEIDCPLGNIAPGGSATVDFTLRALRPGMTGAFWAELRNAVAGPPTGTALLRGIRILSDERCGNLFRAPRTAPVRLVGTIAGDRFVGGPSGEKFQAGLGDDCLFGEAGDDVLGGGEGDDRLYGGAGRDTLRGEAGKDRLSGGPGRDRLEGGPGGDRIGAVDGKRDLVRCGPGRDRARVDANDSVARCERVRRAPGQEAAALAP